MKLKNISLVVLLTAFFFTNCRENNSNRDSVETTSLEGEIRIDGSSTVYPITEAVAGEYRTEQPKVRVTVGVSGTGGGFKKFSRGETDINDDSRPIKDKEINACVENNIDFLELTVAYDGLAVLINKENDWVDHFTVEELKKTWEKKLYSTSKPR